MQRASYRCPSMAAPAWSVSGISGAKLDTDRRVKKWQGRKDSNPRPSVLEFPASILPASIGAAIELEPSVEVDGSRPAWLYRWLYQGVPAQCLASPVKQRACGPRSHDEIRRPLG